MMCICNRLFADLVRFRTEISIGFCSQTAKFVGSGEWNRGAISLVALKREGVAGHV